jgi:hypothetical protein
MSGPGHSGAGLQNPLRQRMDIRDAAWLRERAFFMDSDSLKKKRCPSG